MKVRYQKRKCRTNEERFLHILKKQKWLEKTDIRHADLSRGVVAYFIEDNNEYGKIIEGDMPKKWTQVYVSLYAGYVFVTRYINSEYGFLKGDETDDLVTGIAAWAYIDMPESYRPENSDE